jgi:hypothetical protein
LRGTYNEKITTMSMAAEVSNGADTSHPLPFQMRKIFNDLPERSGVTVIAKRYGR